METVPGNRRSNEDAAADRVEARYRIEKAYPLADAAATMAGKQSTGIFMRVPGETDELRERYAAPVERIVELGAVDAPSLPGSGLPKGHAGPVVRRTAEVTLSFRSFAHPRCASGPQTASAASAGVAPP